MLSEEMQEKLSSLLKDDIGSGDVSSALLHERLCTARITCKQACVLAGMEEAQFLFESKKLVFAAKAKDGRKISSGKIVAEITGLNTNILGVERTALNVLGRMSGVATACAKAKRVVSGTGSKAMPALTRKTMPGFNLFDKKAAEVAGIWPHRKNLSEFVLLKDNHLRFFSGAGAAVLAARQRYGASKIIEIEVSSGEEAVSAAGQGPDMILLDNFSAENAKETVAELRKISNAKIELSGGINFKNLKEFAAAGPDFISMGCLTTNAKSVDFSLEMVKAD